MHLVELSGLHRHITSISFQMCFLLCFYSISRCYVERLVSRYEDQAVQNFSISFKFSSNSIEVSWVIFIRYCWSSFIVLTSFICYFVLLYLFFSLLKYFLLTNCIIILINFSLINFFLRVIFFLCFFYEGVLFPLFY